MEHEVGLIMMTLSLVTGFIDIVAIIVLKRCRTLPTQLRLFSISYLSSDLCTNASQIILKAVHFLHSLYYSYNVVIFERLRYSYVGIFFGSGMIKVAVLACGRVLYIYVPFKYARMSNEGLKSCLFIVFMSLCEFFLVCLSTVQQTIAPCEDCIQRNRIIFCFNFIVCAVVTLVARVALYIVVKKQKNRVQAIQFEPNLIQSRNQKMGTGVIITLTTFTCILTVPIAVYSVYDLNNAGEQNGSMIGPFGQVVYMSTRLITFANMFIYGWKLKECRYQCLVLLCSKCSSIRKKAEHIRRDVFQIVVAPQFDTQTLHTRVV